MAAGKPSPVRPTASMARSSPSGCPLWDYLVGDASQAFRKDDFNRVAFMLRHFLFVKSPFPYMAMWDE